MTSSWRFARLAISLAGLALSGVPTAVRAQGAGGAISATAFVDSTVALSRRRDTASLRRILDPEFAFVHSTGKVDDAAAFLAFVLGMQQDSARSIEPPRTRELGEVAFVLSHTATLVPGRGWTEFQGSDLLRRTAQGWRWLAHQSTALPGSPSFAALDTAAARAYAGRYVSAAGVERVVSFEGDRLLVRTNGRAPVAYGPLTATTFHAVRAESYLVFLRDERGAVRWLEVLARGGAERFARQ
jgi:hypothetical protein